MSKKIMSIFFLRHSINFQLHYLECIEVHSMITCDKKWAATAKSGFFMKEIQVKNASKWQKGHKKSYKIM